MISPLELLTILSNIRKFEKLFKQRLHWKGKRSIAVDNTLPSFKYRQKAHI